MPSRPATAQTDGRLKHNREAAGKVRTTTPKPKKVTARVNARMQQLLDGTLSIKDLDDEEIQKGRCRGPNGKFGKQSELIPSKFYNLVVQELKLRMEKKFAEDVAPMRKVLQEIANNPRTSPDARYKSAVYLIDRGVGKVAEKTEAIVEVKKWEGMLDEVFVDYTTSEASTDEPAKPAARKRAAKKDPFSD